MNTAGNDRLPGADEEAYRRYLSGDEAGAEQLVSKYGDALTNYIGGFVHNAHDAEELMIEAFARLFARERAIHEGGAFRAYLYKIARNLAIRHVRGRFRLFSTEELPFEPQDDARTDAAILGAERAEQLHRAMKLLKAEYREALYLVYFEEMSYRDAAEILKKSERQITNYVYRGKKSLKEILNREGFTYEFD